MESVVICIMVGAYLTLHLTRLSPQPKFAIATGIGMTVSIACMFAGSHLIAFILCLLTSWIFYLAASSLKEWQRQVAQQAIDDEH